MICKLLRFEPWPAGPSLISSLMLCQLSYWTIKCEQPINPFMTVQLGEKFCSNTLYPKYLAIWKQELRIE